MNLGQLAFACYIYGRMTDFDSSYDAIRKATGPALDLTLAPHRVALLKWLNDWGCRQFAKAYHQLAASEIEDWYRGFVTAIPSVGAHLTGLSDQDLNVAEGAYDALADRTACMRRRKGTRDARVTIGPTGAAKILFALRPGSFIPWDEPIRTGLKLRPSGREYVRYLKLAKHHLGELEAQCQEMGHRLDELPELVERPGSTPAKLIDEYYWVTITRNCPVPEKQVIPKWVSWM
jgi:hypothetical protein